MAFHLFSDAAAGVTGEACSPACMLPALQMIFFRKKRAMAERPTARPSVN